MVVSCTWHHSFFETLSWICLFTHFKSKLLQHDTLRAGLNTRTKSSTTTFKKECHDYRMIQAKEIFHSFMLRLHPSVIFIYLLPLKNMNSDECLLCSQKLRADSWWLLVDILHLKLVFPVSLLLVTECRRKWNKREQDCSNSHIVFILKMKRQFGCLVYSLYYFSDLKHCFYDGMKTESSQQYCIGTTNNTFVHK